MDMYSYRGCLWNVRSYEGYPVLKTVLQGAVYYEVFTSVKALNRWIDDWFFYLECAEFSNDDGTTEITIESDLFYGRYAV